MYGRTTSNQIQPWREPWKRSSVKLTNAALDEQENEIILRGVIDPSSLPILKVADYQREILPNGKINSLMTALQAGGVPDIQLGCRGGNYITRENGNYFVQDDVYIIDGLQRTTAARRLMAKGIVPHLGAALYFNTTEDMERKRFRALNVTRVKLSPNVLLRNGRHDSTAVSALFQLCSSSQFILYKRVCWQQRMKRDELISAMTLVKICSMLHRHLGMAHNQRSHEAMMFGLDKVIEKYGRTVIMNNLREFWMMMEDAYSIKDIVYRDGGPALKGGFLTALAKVIATHEDFWTDSEMKIPKELRAKLKSFPLQDPHIAALAASTGASTNVLTQLIVNHLNSGKRTRRLRPFAMPELIIDDDVEAA